MILLCYINSGGKSTLLNAINYVGSILKYKQHQNRDGEIEFGDFEKITFNGEINKDTPVLITCELVCNNAHSDDALKDIAITIEVESTNLVRIHTSFDYEGDKVSISREFNSGVAPPQNNTKINKASTWCLKNDHLNTFFSDIIKASPEAFCVDEENNKSESILECIAINVENRELDAGKTIDNIINLWTPYVPEINDENEMAFIDVAEI